MSFEEEKAKARRVLYIVSALGTTCGPALAIALKEGGASNWASLIILVLSALTGGTGLAVAASKTKQQINSGNFAPPPPVDVEHVVTTGLQQIADEAAAKVNTLNAITQVASTVLPGLAAGAVSAVDRAIGEVTRN